MGTTIERPSSRTGRPIITDYDSVKVERLIAGNAAITGNARVALLSQKLHIHYPGAQAGNSKQDSVFTDDEFTNPDVQRDYETIRYCLMRVPSGYTAEQVQAKLDANPNSVIYRILSNDVFDVMTDEQIGMFNAGRLTYFQRDSQGNIVTDENNKPISKIADREYLEDRYEVRDRKLQRWLDPNGNRQYRQHYYSKDPVEDIDLREGIIPGTRSMPTDTQTVTAEELAQATERV